MKRLLVSTILGSALIVAAVGFGIFPSLEQTASCQGCDKQNIPAAKKIADKFFQECEKLDKDSVVIEELCYKDNIYNKILPILKAFAKNSVGDTSVLFVGETRTGNLLAGGKKTFLVGAPVSKKPMYVQFYGERGVNGANVLICAIDKKGNQTLLGTLKFEENRPDILTRQFEVKGATGKIVQIEITSFGKLVGRIKYNLQIDSKSMSGCTVNGERVCF